MDYQFEIERLDREIHRYFLLRGFERGRRKGMHPGQLPIIAVIAEREGETQSAIARLLKVSDATVAVSIARLERAGLVKKRQDNCDGRSALIELTDEGVRCAAESKAYIKEMLKVKYKGYSEEELKTLYSLMVRARDNLKEEFEK